MNFARFNHVLIPQDARARMDWLKGAKGVFLRGPFRVYLQLTDLGRFLLVFWLFAATMGLNMGQTVCYVVSGLITGLFVASVIAARFCRLADVDVGVTCPPRVQAGAPIEFMVRVANRGPAVDTIDIEPPFLTWDGRWTMSPPRIPQLDADRSETVLCRARFSARGRHSLMPFAVRRVAPPGIVTGKPVMSDLSAFVVVPRFPRIARLSIPAGTRCQPGGVAMASLVGEARELSGVRPYRPGDRLRDVHARTWARTGIPHVREYHQEYFSRIGLLLDTDQKNGAVTEEEFEGAISLAAGCLAHLAGRDTLIDLLVVGQQVHRLTLGRHLGFLEQGLDLLALVTPGQPIDGPGMKRDLSPFIQRLSAAIFICLSESTVHREVAGWMQEQGIPTLRLRVSRRPMATPAPGVRVVTTARIRGNEELVL